MSLPPLASLDAVAPQPPTARAKVSRGLGAAAGRRRTGKDGALPRLPPSLSPRALARPLSLPSLPRPRLRPRPIRCSVFCREDVRARRFPVPWPTLTVAGFWLPSSQGQAPLRTVSRAPGAGQAGAEGRWRPERAFRGRRRWRSPGKGAGRSLSAAGPTGPNAGREFEARGWPRTKRGACPRAGGVR